jgi:hypothetical protein
VKRGKTQWQNYYLNMTINTTLLNKLYSNMPVSQQRGMEATSTPIKPQVTNEDVINKYITRYFLKVAGDNSSLMEVDAQQFVKFSNNPRFVTTSVRWKIVGNPKTKNTNDIIDLGVEDFNKEQVKKADINFGALQSYIRDYLEYWYSDDFGNRTLQRDTQPLSVAKRPVI